MPKQSDCAKCGGHCGKNHIDTRAKTRRRARAQKKTDAEGLEAEKAQKLKQQWDLDVQNQIFSAEQRMPLEEILRQKEEHVIMKLQAEETSRTASESSAERIRTREAQLLASVQARRHQLAVDT